VIRRCAGPRNPLAVACRDTTIMYAFTQATGMVNDHENRCFRRKEIDAKN